MTFRLKLLLAMMVLVVGVTATTLLITENLVSLSYEHHFQQSFRFQVDSFLQQREARLEPIKERVSAAAASTRVFAAMENAGQGQPDQGDIDDLYQNGLDQLSDVMAAMPGPHTNGTRGFYFFLNSKAGLLYPGAQVKLPFSLEGLRRIAQQVEAVGALAGNGSQAQVGYLAPENDLGKKAIREMVFTPIVDQVERQKLGVLGVGFPLPGAGHNNPILSAIWLDDRLYSSSIPSNVLDRVERAVGAELRTGTGPQREFTIRVGDAPHQVYCQALSTGAGFPPAYQVCLYSLADAAAEKQRFTRKILISGIIASLCALMLSWLISRSLAVPIRELVTGTTEIEGGNYAAKVRVRGHDELGRLGHAFNAMAERIRVSHTALEERIAERTHELEERKRAEAALRSSEASLREAQRIARLGNWEWNVPSNELHWSAEVYSIFGLTAQEFDPTYEAFLERVHPADREKVDLAVRRSLKAGEQYSIEHRIILPNGEARIVREQAEVFHDVTGSATRMVGTVQDVTEQKRIEAEFLRAQRMDGIGAIAGGMAHDLNNALSPILMGIQLIRNKVSEPDICQMLSVMETNTHRSADMVRQVLTFARGRDGEREILEVGRLIGEMENILRQTMPKAITVQALVPSDLWPVLGNATQLHQALLNLCVNARDAMPKGGQLTLAADNVKLGPEDTTEIPGSRPGPFVMLLVSDTGTGIPSESLPKIFDAFFTTKAPGKGTGLGLSTIARIVRNHEGFISVKSEVGTGTTFEIYLPRAEPVAASREATLPESSTMKSGHGELIVFIDDDRSVREMVAPTLTEQGYRVLTAANGAEGLALLARREREVRLVLTDVAMPVMDGLELVEKLHSRLPDLPVVLMSGTFDSSKDRLPAGAARFLTKPFRLEQLLNVVADSLRANRVEHDNASSPAGSEPSTFA
ncbi:MAG TPA: PAS domain-containing protein [Verrucomicrobiae bacterium]|nr:PAS domain-containing protein [Verrucomicrobiae bacterium]